jgi:hypothetical protein
MNWIQLECGPVRRMLSTVVRVSVALRLFRLRLFRLDRGYFDGLLISIFQMHAFALALEGPQKFRILPRLRFHFFPAEQFIIARRDAAHVEVPVLIRALLVVKRNRQVTYPLNTRLYEGLPFLPDITRHTPPLSFL